MNPSKIKDIAVIGAGPCGAGFTKALLAENAFSKIKVYERREKFGGLWNYTQLKSKCKEQVVKIPSINPNESVTKINAEGESFFESPVYKYLDANVPKDLMAYNNFPFDDNVPLFPRHDQILNYIERYSKEITDNVSFNEEVTKTILVVGNSASGADIAYQLATGLDRTIYKSIRSENPLPAGKDDRIKDVPDLSSFDPISKTVHFKDGSKLENVDRIIFATGYLKSIPFIKDEPLITDGQKVHGLYKHLIYYNNPTLAVIGLPRFVLPTRLAETQGCWLARIWSGRIELPPLEEMIKFDKSITCEDRKYHDLNYPKDVDYSNELNEQVKKAIGDYGYFAVHWDEEQTKIRSAIKQIKEGYIKYMKDKGRPAYSLKELEDAKYFEYPDPEAEDK
ncbi:unnamed protein product [Wickerhamomyces anomalus]